MEQLKLLFETLIDQANPYKLVLPTDSGLRVLSINQILYCSADGNYTNIKTYDNETILVSKTLKFIEEMLPHGTFFRIHKSTLVNLNYIQSILHKNGYSVTLENSETLDVAQRRMTDLEDIVKKKFSPQNQG